ncbi:hypothetical protein pb186bvf_018151 [Paramecium bursaria]
MMESISLMKQSVLIFCQIIGEGISISMILEFLFLFNSLSFMHHYIDARSKQILTYMFSLYQSILTSHFPLLYQRFFTKQKSLYNHDDSDILKGSIQSYTNIKLACMTQVFMTAFEIQQFLPFDSSDFIKEIQRILNIILYSQTFIILQKYNINNPSKRCGNMFNQPPINFIISSIIIQYIEFPYNLICLQKHSPIPIPMIGPVLCDFIISYQIICQLKKRKLVYYCRKNFVDKIPESFQLKQFPRIFPGQILQ